MLLPGKNVCGISFLNDVSTIYIYILHMCIYYKWKRHVYILYV